MAGAPPCQGAGNSGNFSHRLPFLLLSPSLWPPADLFLRFILKFQILFLSPTLLGGVRETGEGRGGDPILSVVAFGGVSRQLDGNTERND